MPTSTGRIPGCSPRFRLLPVLAALPPALALTLAGLPTSGRAAPPAAAITTPTTAEAIAAAVKGRVPGELKAFYAARDWRPLWLTATGTPRPAVLALRDQINEARVDGLSPSQLRIDDLRRAIDRAASGEPADLARLEIAASRAFTGWVRALRGAEHAPMLYESEALAPVVPTAAAALEAAAAARSLDAYAPAMGWMHPLYAPLRAALLDPDRPDAQRRAIAASLLRVRAIPANPADRYVLVDAAGARLWMIEQGRVVDSMKVVVGKPDNQTPMMAGFLRNAILNPYWNIPDDLVAERVARGVLDKGVGYLRAAGYEVLSGWEDDATVIDPAGVDWAAVAAGRATARVRQLPGRDNFMGKVKFMFPNAQGIYLHDTPAKDLMRLDERLYSSGCVRLEDAARLGRWLLGKPLPSRVREQEKPVALPEVVPLYITYLTAFPQGAGFPGVAVKTPATAIAFRSDAYGRDGAVTSRQPILASSRAR